MHNRVLILTFIPFVAFALQLGSFVNADIFNFHADIEQSQEVPPSGSLGIGSATISFDDATNDLSWNITWSGLTGPATAMHFHNAPAGVNDIPVINIGNISGLNSPSIGSTVISNFLATELFAERLYINIHTASFPGGEIRGQVLVPEPSSATLVGLLGMVGLGFASRRKRKI